MTRPLTSHLEPVMGTVVALVSPGPMPAAGIHAAVEALHDADRVFSTWKPDSPLSRLRTGEITTDDLAPGDAALVREVLDRCLLARELTGGAFDPWALPGGVDPTGLVKGWAAARALTALMRAGVTTGMVNAGGDIATAGRPGGRPWRIGLRHPSLPDRLIGVVATNGAVATSGDYERPGQLLDPATGGPARAAASATVVGPELDLADALATGLAVAGPSLLPVIDGLLGYEAHLVTVDGRHFATPGLALADPAA